MTAEERAVAIESFERQASKFSSDGQLSRDAVLRYAVNWERMLQEQWIVLKEHATNGQSSETLDILLRFGKIRIKKLNRIMVEGTWINLPDIRIPTADLPPPQKSNGACQIKNGDVLEILQFAMKATYSARDLYRTLAGSVGDPDLQTLFRRLASDKEYQLLQIHQFVRHAQAKSNALNK